MPVKFFCERCGKELWELAEWNESQWQAYTLVELLCMCVCTDCLLKKIREYMEGLDEDTDES